MIKSVRSPLLALSKGQSRSVSGRVTPATPIQRGFAKLSGDNFDAPPKGASATAYSPRIKFRYAALKSAPNAIMMRSAQITPDLGKAQNDEPWTGALTPETNTTRAPLNEGPKMPRANQTDHAWRAMRAELAPAFDSLSDDAETLLYHLWLGQTARSIDETQTEWTKGRIPFAIWGAGQELAQTLMVAEGPKFISGYYRDVAATLASGATDPQALMAQALGDTQPGHDPASGGRMMGNHFGDRALDAQGNPLAMQDQIRIMSRSSSLASQMPAAAGIGAELKGTGDFNLVMLGDATCAEGLFWESLNQMAIEGQPTVIMVMDNDYGITVPSNLQVTHANISKAAAGLSPALEIIGPVKGWDYPAMQKATAQAADTARQDNRPVLLHVKCTRPFGHSSTGGTRAIPASRLEYEHQHDCIEHFEQALKDKGIDPDLIEKVRSGAKEAVKDAADSAWAGYYEPIAQEATQAINLFDAITAPDSKNPDWQRLQQKAAELKSRCKLDAPSSLTRSEIELFLRDVLDVLHQQDSAAESTQAVAQYIRGLQSESIERWSSHTVAPTNHSGLNATPVPPSYGASTHQENGKPLKDTQAHIIAAGLSTLLQQLPDFTIFGEDTGALGGVSTCTLGLQSGESQVLPDIWRRSPALQRYIPEQGFGQRVHDTGIAEAFIVGKAIGRAQLGKPSAAEIQYLDYMPYALQQLIDEAAPMRHRTAGGQESPFLLRTHGHRLLGMWHSGSPMGMLMGIPGLRVLTPRNGTQAVGLYRSALVDGKDPTVSIESLSEMYAQEPVPDNLESLTIPLGASEIILDTTGDDQAEDNQCTIVTYGGASCKIAQQAAQQLKQEGIGVKVVDLQTLSPLDVNDVAKDAIRATGKVLWLDEDYPNGAMAMIAKNLVHGGAENDKPFYSIESERFLTARPHKPAYGKDGGYYSKPQTYDVIDTVRRLLDDADGGARAPKGIMSQDEIQSTFR